jgi:hypothetical protein
MVDGGQGEQLSGRHARARGGLPAALLMAVLTGCAGTGAEFEPARTAWGTPRIDGLWDFRTLTPLERPAEYADKAFLDPEEARALRSKLLAVNDVDARADESSVDVEGAYNSFWYDWGTELGEDLRTSLIVDPADGRLPGITSEALARLEEQNRHRSPPVRDLFSFSADVSEFRPADPEALGLSERCLVGFNAGPPLSPSAYNNNLRIVQTPDHVVLVTEMIHDARIVPLDGRAHLPAEMERWSGDSRGWWEGNTLVVETTNITGKKPTLQLPATIDSLVAGAVGSADTVRLRERFTLVAPDRLLYEYTLDDPSTFVRPFSVAIPMRASTAQMYEYACHEGNYAVPGMLRGARLLDAEAGAG